MCVDSPLPHLDRLFDYSVPSKLEGIVEIGTRVRVPFHGRLVGGIVCEMGRSGGFTGRISEIRSAGAVPSITEAGIDLARKVARRYGGSLWDVLRLAVPPRVASVEKRWVGRIQGGSAPDPNARERLTAAAMLARAGVRSESPFGDRTVWEAVPEPDRASLPSQAVLAPILECAASGGNAVLVVPDARAVSAVSARLQGFGLSRWTSRSGGDFAVVQAEDGPSVRYENYLAGLTGSAPIVVGTRSTAFQPVPSLGLLALWVDGHTAFQDPRTPHPHARTVAAIRTEAERSRLMLGAWAPSVEAQALVEHGWAEWAPADRVAIRATVPAVTVLTAEKREEEGPGGWHWMPGAAWRVLGEGLREGAVFVLVPRAGYVTSLACTACGQWARCLACEGPLALKGRGVPPSCLDCGADNPDWHCPDCHSNRLSESRQGVARIAEQIRRMAPGVEVMVSSAATGIVEDGVVVGGIVVATPGALPSARGGYAAGVVIGADSGLTARAEVDTPGLLFGAAALVRSREAGGRVAVVGDLDPSVRRALETWTPGDLAREGAAERASLGLPPFGRVVKVEATQDLLRRVSGLRIGQAELASHAEVAVVPSRGGSLVFLCGRRIAQEVVDGLRALQKDVSAAGEGEIRLRVDGPLEASG
ncbi:MAG: primosomal protein N' [Demequinaceae bacterium]|nr:primosomal protein N' [Demequinaceae bacterium]